MAAFILLLITFFSFFLWIITPLLPLIPAVLILLWQILITTIAFVFWRRRRKRGRSAFFRALLVAINFLFLIAMGGVILLINLPHEKKGDSIEFLKGLKRIIQEKTGLFKSQNEIQIEIDNLDKKVFL